MIRSPFQNEVKLGDQVAFRLTELFMEKGWPIKSPLDDKLFHPWFARSRAMLSRLNEQQQDVVLKLLMDFEVYSLEKYKNMFNEAVRLFITFIDSNPSLADIQHLTYVTVGFDKVVTTIKVLKTKNIVNSSYSLMNYIAPALFDGSGLSSRFTIIRFPELSSDKNPLPNKHIIVLLIDDFVGTGSKTIDTIKYLKKKIKDYQKTKKELVPIYIVITLASCREVQAAINNYFGRDIDVRVFSTVTLDKGISDSVSIIDKKSTYKIVREITDLLDFGENNSANNCFGFDQSETLVSMVQTPDNTFPIFWCRRDKEGSEWPSPFWRNK